MDNEKVEVCENKADESELETLKREINILKSNERILQETIVRLSMKLVGLQ